ncbi:hypothetical protein [Rhizobium sp. SYY.PMSO]|uniref:hypothetical protein n=1 Tax=Rhizobium sp. SYY.PMSO TaxID=3382192 RepID=UPI00398FD17D
MHNCCFCRKRWTITSARILCRHVSHAIKVSQVRSVTDGLRTATPADLQNLARKAKRSARSKGGTVTLEDLRTSLPARTKLPEVAVLRIAVHECGHVIVTLASRLVDELVIELEDSFVEEGSDLQEGGRVLCQMTETMLPTEATLLARIRIALAGMAAEEVVQGSKGAGATGSDLDTATQIASQMVLSYGMGKSLRFHVDRQRIVTGFMPPPEFHAEISGILSKEYRTANDGMTMLCVTRGMGFARKVADRVVFMDQGRIIEDSTPAEFFQNPKHERSKLFMSQILGH